MRLLQYVVCRHQFKAQPINEHILTHHGIGVKVVPRKPTTVPEPFDLTSPTRRHNYSTAESDEGKQNVFHAKPVPKAILEGVVVCLTISICASSVIPVMHCYTEIRRII